MLSEPQAVSQLQADIQKAEALVARPGVVFSEPLREGTRTIITSSRIVMRGGLVHIRPHALIVISPEGVQVQPIQARRPISILWAVAAVAFIGTVPILFAPPWRPDFNLFAEIRQLIDTMRRPACGATWQRLIPSPWKRHTSEPARISGASSCSNITCCTPCQSNTACWQCT